MQHIQKIIRKFFGVKTFGFLLSVGIGFTNLSVMAASKSAPSAEAILTKQFFRLKPNPNCADKFQCLITSDHSLRIDIADNRDEVYVCFDCRKEEPEIRFRKKLGSHLATVIRGNYDLLVNRFTSSCSMRAGFRKDGETFALSLENLAANPRGCRLQKRLQED